MLGSLVRMTVSRSPPRDRGCSDREPSEGNSSDAPKILCGSDYFAPLARNSQDLHAGTALEVDMRGGAYVGPPSVFGGRDPLQYTWCLVTVKQHKTGHRVGIWVPQLLLCELLSDESTDRVRPTLGVPLLHPSVQELEERGLQRDAETRDLVGHAYGMWPEPMRASRSEHDTR